MNKKAFFTGNVKDFRKATERPHKFARYLRREYEDLQTKIPERKPLSRGEYLSWVYSLPEFADLLHRAHLGSDQIVIVEGILQIRNHFRRVDTIVCGQQENGKQSVNPWELKRWNKSNGFSIHFGSKDKPYVVELRQNNEFYQEEVHPSVRIAKYRNILAMRIAKALSKDKSEVGVRAFVFFDQQKNNFDESWRRVLYGKQYKELVKGSFPEMITRNRTAGVEDNLSRYAGSGNGEQIAQILEEKILGLDPENTTQD